MRNFSSGDAWQLYLSSCAVISTFAAGKAVISCRDKETTLTALFSSYQRGRSLVAITRITTTMTSSAAAFAELADTRMPIKQLLNARPCHSATYLRPR